jgi:hypothetical protein
VTKVDRYAEDFAEAVRQAFAVTFGVPRNEDTWKSIRSSWSMTSVKQGWVDPDPSVVVVGTEYGWVQDPHRHRDYHEMWEKTMLVLKDFNWGDTAWESINAAVHIVFIKVPTEWQKQLQKQKENRFL